MSKVLRQDLLSVGGGLPHFCSPAFDSTLTRVSRRFQLAAVDLTQILSAELAKRRKRNPRYSLRAFARDLGSDHATLSQLIRGRRVLSPRMAKKFGAKLHLRAVDISEACEQHNAEAILRLAGAPGFRPNSRWIATRTGLSLDGVNTALARLLHQRQLVMETASRWTFLPKSHAQSGHPLATHYA